MGFIRELILLPSVIVGMIVCAGLVLQKKSLESVIKGVIKSMIGFQIISIGGRIIAEAVEPFGKMFQKGFHISGIMLNVEAVTGLAVERYGTQISVIMLLGLAVNLLLARITRFRYVFTTGHHVLYMSCILACVINAYHIDGIKGYLIAALALGISMVLSPAILETYTKRICNNDKIAMGHFGGTSYLVAAWLGKLYGDETHSIEDIHFPKKLSFLRDASITVSITMAVMYIIVALAAGKSFVESGLSDGGNYIVYAFSQSLTFSVGFVVVTTGIRWFINEIVPAVKGFADNWIPDAKAAVDCPFVFPFAPNALLVGFLSSFLGGLLSLFVMWACDLTLILPGIVPHFFCGATAGVYGNSTGGIRGTFLGGFFNGLYMSFLPLLFLPHLGAMVDMSVTYPDQDLGIVAFFIGKCMNRSGGWGTLVILLGIVIIMMLLPRMMENREKDVPWFLEGRENLYKTEADKTKEMK